MLEGVTSGCGWRSIGGALDTDTTTAASGLDTDGTG